MSFDEEITEPDTEVMKYIKEPVHTFTDVNKWWCEHAKVFPNLFRLFVKLSCVPATSASSERTFSTAGNVITDKRSLLLPENVNNIILVRNSL